MKSLILTGWLIPEFTKPDFADLAVDFSFRFVWGPLPSPDELAAHLGPRAPDHAPGHHWSDFASRWSRSENRSRRDLSLAEFCQQYETVELWFDTQPNAQLRLVWELGKWRPHMVDVTDRDLAIASATWQAYRASTPEACFALLRKDLSLLPLLKPVLLNLLEELPSASTGLGTSEMRMLEMIASGYGNVNPLFHFRSVRRTRVFNEWELGYLLDGLAFGPRPAIAGLDDELRTIRKENFRDRHKALLRSRLSLTDFGNAVVAHKEDFSRHNPIDRWWGGTHLTNDRLWRWNPALVKP